MACPTYIVLEAAGVRRYLGRFREEDTACAADEDDHRERNEGLLRSEHHSWIDRKAGEDERLAGNGLGPALVNCSGGHRDRVVVEEALGSAAAEDGCEIEWAVALALSGRAFQCWVPHKTEGKHSTAHRMREDHECRLEESGSVNRESIVDEEDALHTSGAVRIGCPSPRLPSSGAEQRRLRYCNRDYLLLASK